MDRSRPAGAGVPFDTEAADGLLDIVARFEGDYWSLNLDEEFEGRFDQPARDAAGNRIPVAQRRSHPDFTPNPFSKYGPRPGHVGLSFGFIQFTQDSGSLGKLLTKMQAEDPGAFQGSFGEHADELVRVTNLPGAAAVVPDAASPLGKVRRSPRVAPIGGADLWQSPWKERFLAAGKHPPFQKAQRQLAAENYLRPIIEHAALPFHVRSQKGLCVLLDRSIQLGPMGCVRLLQAIWGSLQARQSPEAKRFEALYLGVREKPWSHRMRKILDGDETSFDVTYELA